MSRPGSSSPRMPTMRRPNERSRMKSAAELVCVDPAKVHRVWPHVAELIRTAMWRADFGAFAPVQASVLAGDALLWIAFTGDSIAAAVVTEISMTERRKVCGIVACGGHDMP